MDRLISLEPSNLVVIKVEQGQKCYGQLTLRNVMHTMPVAFKVQPMNQARYTIRPQSGIIAPLSTTSIEIIYLPPPNTRVPESIPESDDWFQLHSLVAPGALAKGNNLFSSTNNPIPKEWFTSKKKQVYIDCGIKVMLVGHQIMARLVSNGSAGEIRKALENSDTNWKLVDSIDENGQTLLHLAIARSRPNIVQLLLEFGPDVEVRSQAGFSPLEAAVAAGQALIVELLLAHKASPDKAETSIAGPIHYAAWAGHLEILRMILLKGAQVNALTRNGETALHLAVKKQKKDCVRVLLANGAEIDIQNNLDRETALHIASGLGDEHIVKLLIQKGANKDVRNQFKKLAYDIAAEKGYTKLFDPLRLGDSLSLSARKGEKVAIQRLIGNGALINGVDQNKWTALHRASFKGKIEAVKMLIENGISVNAKDEEGYTALHCAVEAGHADVVEYLLKRGANLEEKTNKNMTAVQISKLFGYIGITKTLDYGNKKDVFDDEISFGNKIKLKNKEVDIGEIKKKFNKMRTSSRKSYNQSMLLAVA